MDNNEQKMRAGQAQTPAVKKDTRIEGSAAEGLLEAVASTAMAVVALLMTLFSNIAIIAEVLCMYGLILGVRAVRTYRDCHLWQKKKPKATGVLGIIGLVLNSIAVLFWLWWLAFMFMDLFLVKQALVF